MAVEENVQLMRRWFREVWNEKRTDTIRELLAPDAVAIGELEDGQALRGVEQFVSFAEKLRGAFPDMKLKVEDVFGVGDKVVLRWSGMMTHTGDHLGMAATGKEIQLTGITIAQIREGKIIAGWDNWDQLGMHKQLGLYVSPQTDLPKSA